MTEYGRSWGWAAALALGLACLIGAGAATVHAAPEARTTASTFELTLEATLTPPFFWLSEGTFRSRAPFCATGTFAWGSAARPQPVLRFTCEDGTGTLTVSIPKPNEDYHGPPFDTWRIFDGSGTYAGFRGKGSLQGETCGQRCDLGKPIPWRGSLLGLVDRDAVAPTIAFTSVTATRLRRPAGAYALRLGIALRDDVADNPVTYTVRACAYYIGCHVVARRSGTDLTRAVFSMTLRIRPPAGATTVQLQLTGEDPVGNAVSASRDVKLSG